MVQGTKACTSAFAAMHGFVENFANVKKKLQTYLTRPILEVKFALGRCICF
jgi:hypothetical protein